MASTYLAFKTISCKIFPYSYPLKFNCTVKRIITSSESVHRNGYSLSHSSSFLSSNPVFQGGTSYGGKRHFTPAKADDRESEPSEKESKDDDDENRALKAVLGLYTALKKRDVQGLSDVLSEECLCMSNFISAFKLFQGKHQVMEFFSALMGTLGEHVHFIVKPTLHDGLGIGVAWKLECSKTHAPLGKGFSFYTCHEYEGKVLIRNVEMFLEPLLNLAPLRLKFIPLFTAAVMPVLGFFKLINGHVDVKAIKSVYVLLSILLMAMSFFFLKLSLS